MKKLLLMLVLCCACTIANKLIAQSLDFKNTVYYTAAGNTLTSSGQSLTGFDYSTAPSTHPIFNGGIFFPVQDFQGNNIWVKVTHIAADPNGTSVGVNVPATCSDPFRAGFGGWAGFLYQFEIYKDATITGTPSNTLDGLFPSNISVESIETLSAGEWLSFELLNAESNNWALNSINFTGNNPGSNPGFSAVSIPWPGSQPPPGFSTTFPVSSKNIYVVDYGGGSYAEFKMSAENVSRFNYGYEYTGLCGGYQGMNLSFGNRVIPRVGIAVSQGSNPGCAGSLLEFKATPVNAGAGPAYEWKRNGADVVGANTDTYSSNNFTAGEVITCVMTTSLNTSATSNSITILTPTPASTWYLDADGDQYYTGSPVVSCSSPGTGYTTTVFPGGDCNDNNKDVHPGATEICGNGIDDNCDGQIDEGCTVYTFYKDADGDTYGNPASSVTNYTGIVPAGYVANNTDCDDTRSTVHSGATEICGNGIDDNCNGQIDEGCTLYTFYKDADNDTYGNAASSVTNFTGIAPAGYVTNKTDCDDTRSTVYPGAPEICGNGLDDNCNGQIDEGCTLYTFYKDADNDTYGNAASSVTNFTGIAPAGYVTNKTDCDDTRSTVHPGAVEICGNGIDDNCNGQIDEGCTLYTFYKDADNDTYGNAASSVTNFTGIIPAGYVTNKTDCDDTKSTVHPGATEICGNGIDDNCNGQIDENCSSTITVSISDASITEGDWGTKLLSFAVSLSKAGTATSTVKYKTSNGTALAGSDYKAADATISFAAGQSVKYASVVIKGDYKVEPNETFYVTLYSPVNLLLGGKKTGTGTIINDDKYDKDNDKEEILSSSKFADENSSSLKVPSLLRRGQLLDILNLPANNKVMLYNANGMLILNVVNYSNNKSLSNTAAGLYYYNIIIANSEGKQETVKGKIVIMD